jgi:ABC-2 type transport system permease protein
MSEAPAAPPGVWADPYAGLPRLGPTRVLLSRTVTFCTIETQRLRHDRTELATRMIQPLLWLLIFGETFNRTHVIPTGSSIPYLDYLAPGVIAQSGMFTAIFYGIQIIWERDSGLLARLMATPTPRPALIAGKAFAASIRAVLQLVVVLALALVLGVTLHTNPVKLVGVLIVAVLGTVFFASLSMIIAGLARSRERLMGLGQAITMPLFFASNALYPVAIMPLWLKVLSHVNPLSYQVSAMRDLLLGSPSNLWLDFAVLVGAAVGGVALAAHLVTRLVR